MKTQTARRKTRTKKLLLNSPAKRASTLGFAHRTWTRPSSFYFLLMGSSPVKLKHDYAKWEPADPSVNLSITTGGSGDPGGALIRESR